MDLLNDPQWLRSALQLLIVQLGGQVVLDLKPAIALAAVDPPVDFGQMTYAYSDDGTSLLLTATPLPTIPEVPGAPAETNHG